MTGNFELGSGSGKGHSSLKAFLRVWKFFAVGEESQNRETGPGGL